MDLQLIIPEEETERKMKNEEGTSKRNMIKKIQSGHHTSNDFVLCIFEELSVPSETGSTGRALEGFFSSVCPHVSRQFSRSMDDLLTDRTLLGRLRLPLPPPSHC